MSPSCGVMQLLISHFVGSKKIKFFSEHRCNVTFSGPSSAGPVCSSRTSTADVTKVTPPSGSSAFFCFFFARFVCLCTRAAQSICFRFALLVLSSGLLFATKHQSQKLPAIFVVVLSCAARHCRERCISYLGR